MLLHGNNGLVEQSSSKVRIIAETFPVATATNDSTQTSANRSKGNVGTLSLELSSEVLLSFVNKGLVPSSTEMKARWVTVDAVGVADTITVVNQAKARESESRNTARNARASSR